MYCSLAFWVFALMSLPIVDEPVDRSASLAAALAPRSSLVLVLDSTNYTAGSGDIRARNQSGTAGNNYLTFATTNPGAFPSDWFYGIAINSNDFAFELLKPPPFSGVLITGSSGGESTWQGTNTAWSLITVYAVSLEFTPAWTFVQASAPVSYTIP